MFTLTEKSDFKENEYITILYESMVGSYGNMRTYYHKTMK